MCEHLCFLLADGELIPSVEDAECPEVVRSEESAAVGLRNLVTQWHIHQKGGLQCCANCSHAQVTLYISSNACQHLPNAV